MLNINNLFNKFYNKGVYCLMRRLLSSLLVFSTVLTSCFGVHCFADCKKDLNESSSRIISKGVSNECVEKGELLESVESTEKRIKADKDIKEADKNKLIEKLEDTKKEIKEDSNFISKAKIFAKYAAIISIPFILGYVYGESKTVQSRDLRDNNFRLNCEKIMNYFPVLKSIQNYIRAEVAKSTVFQGLSDLIDIFSLKFSNYTNGDIPSSYISYPTKTVILGGITVLKPIYDILKLFKDFVGLL